VSIIEVYKPDSRILAQGYLIADVEQVPAPLQEIDAAVNVNASADARSEGAQRDVLKDGSLQ
jgi:hypothetical protein